MLSPYDVVTVMPTVPVLPEGATTVSWVSETTVNPVAGVDPNSTAVAPAKPAPVTVTVVPPLVVPDCGEIPVTVGGAGLTVKFRSPVALVVFVASVTCAVNAELPLAVGVPDSSPEGLRVTPGGSEPVSTDQV